MDVVGLVLLLAAVAWTLVAAAANDGSRPWPTVATYGGLGVAVALGRRLRTWFAGGDRLLVAATGLGGLLLGLLVRFEVAGAGSPPLGYGNANGAAFGLVVLAIVGARSATNHPSRAGRRAAAIVLAVAGAATAASGSAGATAATAAGLSVAGVATVGHHRRAAVPMVACLVLVAWGVTFAVARGAGPDTLAGDSFGTRAALWREAATIAEDHPRAGVGPGRFQEVTTVSADADLRRAHSTPLQTAAEQGAPGLVLLFALGVWAVAALWSARRDRLVAVGAGVVLAVGLQACWDWVLADPAVSLPAALLVGLATRRAPLPARRIRG